MCVCARARARVLHKESAVLTKIVSHQKHVLYFFYNKTDEQKHLNKGVVLRHGLCNLVGRLPGQIRLQLQPLDAITALTWV